MFKTFIFIMALLLLASCYGNDNELYSKNLEVITKVKIYDIDRIENNIVILISKDLKEVKKMKLSFFKKEIKEGYQITYIDGEIYISKNNKLKSKISKILFELNPENKRYSLNL
jgi:hypothetical protein